MGLIYLDSCICIYAMEPASRFHTAILSAFASNPDAQFAISPLVIGECLVAPLRNGDTFLVQDYEAFFRRTLVLDLNEAIFRHAASIRATSNLKMPDALHLACAQFHACDALWTNDDRLAGVGGTLARAIVG